MMVVTRGQTVNDGPVMPTTSTTAPVCHNANVTTVSEAGSKGRCGERAVSTDPTASAVSGIQTSQTATNTRSTQMGPTLRSGLPWLPTDDESGAEPHYPYPQGDRPDPLKTDWERTVGGAVGGNRRLVPPSVWGYRTAMSRSVPAPNAVTESARPVLTAPGEESTIHGARRHPLPLDAPDVALRGQRLLAYEERL